jgi:hypothetical protein
MLWADTVTAHLPGPFGALSSRATASGSDRFSSGSNGFGWTTNRDDVMALEPEHAPGRQGVFAAAWELTLSPGVSVKGQDCPAERTGLQQELLGHRFLLLDPSGIVLKSTSNNRHII